MCLGEVRRRGRRTSSANLRRVVSNQHLPSQGVSSSSSEPTIILGAGLAGLSAARRLAEAGRPVLLLDKGRSVGGRLATRRMGHAVFDHGAQFFTVRSDEFQTEVDQWVDAGVAEVWSQGFGPDPDGHPRYRGSSGMNAVAKHVADRLTDSYDNVTIVTRTEANAIINDGEAWTVTYQGPTREPDVAAAVICTAPIPQTLALLRAGVTSVEGLVDLQAVRYHRVIAVLAALDRSPELPEPGAVQQPADPSFTFVADNQAKGISRDPAVTFHLNPNLAASLWDSDDASVLAAIHEDLRSYLNGAAVTQIQVKRWRYSGPVQPHAERCVVAATNPGPVVLAGDGFAGSKVEGAFLSGLAAADNVLAFHQSLA